MDLRGVIQQFLSESQRMELGTSQNNQPLVTTVYFSFDNNLSIYWLSDPSKRHSQEIEKNPKVAGSFILPHVYGQKVRGLRFEGEANLLKGKDLENGVMIYKSRFWIVEDRAMGHDANKTIYCYKAVPKSFYLYDEITYTQNPSQILKI